jgi:hypothetical protein
LLLDLLRHTEELIVVFSYQLTLLIWRATLASSIFNGIESIEEVEGLTDQDGQDGRAFRAIVWKIWVVGAGNSQMRTR